MPVTWAQYINISVQLCMFICIYVRYVYIYTYMDIYVHICIAQGGARAGNARQHVCTYMLIYLYMSYILGSKIELEKKKKAAEMKAAT